MDDYSSYRVDNSIAKELGLPDQDRILYVLTLDDLAQVYGDIIDKTEDYHEGDPIHFWDLPDDKRDELIHTVRKYIESWAGDGGYTWYDAMVQAINDNEAELAEQESQLN